MVRLTADLLQSSPSYLNPVKDRELDLRGHKAPAIENLGVTRDQNEAIDLTDNDVRYLGNFPRFTRLRTLLLSNNRISSVSPNFASTVPNLRHLVLTNNAIGELGDLDPLSGLRHLELLVVMGNPVCKHDRYRAWMVWNNPSLRILDYARVTQRERSAAVELFGSGRDSMTPLAASIAGVKSQMFDVDATDAVNGTMNNGGAGVGLGRISEDEKKRIQVAIMNATSMAEVQKLEAMLAEGRVPDR